MEQIRISERNSIRNDIKTLEIQVKRNNETIKRLHNLEDSTDFYKLKIVKLKEQIKLDEDKIISLNQKIEDINSGKYDSDFIKSREDNNIDMKNKINLSKKKSSDEHEKKQEDKKNLDIDYKSFRKYEGINDKTIEKETEKFLKNSDSIPDYMKNNLKEIYNNKGYIWKGITFFGFLPRERDKTILFEKNRGNILKIYEIDEYDCKIFEKEGKKQKVLISTTRRIKF